MIEQLLNRLHLTTRPRLTDEDVSHCHLGRAHLNGGTTLYQAPVRGEHFRRCGYCSSIHPQDLIAAMDAGQVDHLDMADWKYGWPHKVYLDVLTENAGQLHWLGGTSGGRKPPTDDELRDRGMIPTRHLTRAERAACKMSGVKPDDYHGHTIGTRAKHHAKFYTVHMTEPWLTEPERELLARRVGYRIERLPTGNIRWESAFATTGGNADG